VRDDVRRRSIRSMCTCCITASNRVSRYTYSRARRTLRQWPNGSIDVALHVSCPNVCTEADSYLISPRAPRSDAAPHSSPLGSPAPLPKFDPRRRRPTSGDRRCWHRWRPNRTSPLSTAWPATATGRWKPECANANARCPTSVHRFCRSSSELRTENMVRTQVSPLPIAQGMVGAVARCDGHPDRRDVPRLRVAA
jgi:hypothetical protein